MQFVKALFDNVENADAVKGNRMHEFDHGQFEILEFSFFMKPSSSDSRFSPMKEILKAEESDDSRISKISLNQHLSKPKNLMNLL